MRIHGIGHATIALLLAAACADAGGEPADDDPVEDPPPTVSWAEELPEGNPLTGLPEPGEMREIEVTDAAAQRGQTIYADNCVPCHGPDGEGRLGIGPKLNSTTFLAAAADDYLVRTIARGRPGTTMPGWARTLERSEVEDVIAYMRGWQEVEPVELDNRPATGDAEAGGERFREICAGCHGFNGAGYQETSNGTGIGRSAFLADASNGYLRHIIRNGKTDTPMRPFGRPSAVAVANLTDEDVENVITYLRDNAW